MAMHANCMRRSNILKGLNPHIVDRAVEDSTFGDSAEDCSLVMASVIQKAKERNDELIEGSE